MITYEVGTWQITYAFRLSGSVLPRAAVMAFVTLFLSCGCWFILNGFQHSIDDIAALEQEANTASAVKVLSSILAFYLTFRASIAYSRYMEGATLLAQIRGAWTNAASSVFAFCSYREDDKEKVVAFQNLFARLMSLMFAIAIQKISESGDSEEFEVLDTHGIDKDSLSFLADSEDRIQVILQWIQRLVIVNLDQKTLTVAPPLATRIFQELGQGIVNVNNAQKLTVVPFPFCFAQVSTALLLFHMSIMVCVAPLMYSRIQTMGVAVFFSTLALWSINFIAAELERPFGFDDNDIPIARIQRGFNASLCCMLEEMAQRPPTFDMSLASHGCEKSCWRADESGQSKLVNIQKTNVVKKSSSYLPKHVPRDRKHVPPEASSWHSLNSDYFLPKHNRRTPVGTLSEPGGDFLTALQVTLRSLQDCLYHLPDVSRLMSGGSVHSISPSSLNPGEQQSSSSPSRGGSGFSPSMEIATEIHDADKVLRGVLQARTSGTKHSPLSARTSATKRSPLAAETEKDEEI